MRATNKSRVLALLRRNSNEWVPGNWLVEVGGGWRYGDVIWRLRHKDGFNIETRPDPTGQSAVYQYRLVIDQPAPGQEALPW